MLRSTVSFCRLAAAAAFLPMCLISSFVGAARRSPEQATVFAVPLPEARGFCEHQGRLAVFDYPQRTLYLSDAIGRMKAVESMDGWAISDVTFVAGAPVYCSRNRIIQVINGRTQQTVIEGASDLRSIATDGTLVYLLDDGPAPAIISLHGRTGQVISRRAYDGYRPIDLAASKQGLFVLDRGDRCVHQFDLVAGKTVLKMQVGPGVSQGSGGICFLGDDLYVHEADHQRLRPLPWRVDGNFVASWIKPLHLTFVQESTNVSSSESMKMDFDVPLPMRTTSQIVGPITWSQEPLETVTDRFGQTIAKHRAIPLEPQESHTLTYDVDVFARAVQYNPPPAPIKSLNRIPDDIKEIYLADESMYRMQTSEMVIAAKEARSGRDGSSPKDVRALITNIAWYLSARFKYAMDDTWDDARTSLMRGSGSCSEYSFVFASLCRLNGVPTRLVGGIQMNDYATPHTSEIFHRWNEVYYPGLGWIPVDVTKFDDAAEDRRDFEFLFGTPGYVITLSRGGIDPDHLGPTYYIRRKYHGGKRVRSNYVKFAPIEAKPSRQILLQFP